MPMSDKNNSNMLKHVKMISSFLFANDDNKFNYFGMWLEQNRIYYKILIDMVEYFQDMQVNIIEKYPFWIYA